MNRLIISCLLVCCCTMAALAQGSIKGKVIDKTSNEPFEFVNVAIYQQRDTTKILKGGITDGTGGFNITGLDNGSYLLSLTFVGYKTLTRNFSITNQRRNINLGTLTLAEDSQILQEFTVTGQRSNVKLEVDRKSFDVDQQIANAGGSASDVLENIPSVEVDQDGNVSLRGNESVEVWINGKASGLTADNRGQILQQLPAESIERIEVIDNPSAKFSAEGSAGIINIVLKKDRKAGYYGSFQVGGGTNKGANTSANINYNSGLLDAYANLGYRHRHNNQGGTWSRQDYLATDEYQNYDSKSRMRGNGLFGRAGVTLHATRKDDFTVGGMGMFGGGNNGSDALYHYGNRGAAQDTRQMFRRTTSSDDMRMMHGEFDYRHEFALAHTLDFMVSFDRWKMDNDNTYQDSTTYMDGSPTIYDNLYRPMFINNRAWEIKLDYENQISKTVKLQAGYNGRLAHENTPQESWVDYNSWYGTNMTEDEAYFNRFIYDQDTHALYATTSVQLGKLGVMGGLRGEYWKVNTESYNYDQEHNANLRDKPFEKDYFELFPSVFLSYQLTPTQQLQLNYTRRLRRPWGGQLNSFKNTRDASIIEYGNPQLTPEYTNAFSLNYLKQWTDHTLSLSAYYRPTTDVIQRIKYQSSTDGLMYTTNENVAKSESTGLEIILKDKLFRILDLTTTVNTYYYKLDGFSYLIDGQTVTGESDHNFSWTGRMMASLMLPFDISLQASGNYRSRQVVTQGYRKPNYDVDLGLRKTFMNKKLALSVNVRDLLDSRHFEVITGSDTFSRHQRMWRGGRRAMMTLTWSFGNSKPKKPEHERGGEDDDRSSQDQYSGGEE